MILKLNGLEVDCIIGERADERERTQRLLVDLEMEIPDTASRTDNLADTVDYAALTERVRRTLAEARCQMIERAARLVAEVAKSSSTPSVPIGRVRVSVTKTGAIAYLASATAVLEVP